MDCYDYILFSAIEQFQFQIKAGSEIDSDHQYSENKISLSGIFANAVAGYRRLPDWQRTAMERAGASILILISVSHLATYYYAISYGARLPLEGVPFLIVVSITCSIVLTFFSLFTLLMLPLGREEGVQSAEHKNANKKWSIPALYNASFEALSEVYIETRSYSLHRRLSRMALVIIKETAFARLVALSYAFIAIVATAVTGLPILERLFGEFFDPEAFNDAGGPPLLLLIISFVFALTFILIFFGKTSKKSIKVASKGIYLSAVILVGVQMFGSMFDQILRASRYGGGIEVTILMRDGEKREGRYLFLVSSDTMTIWDKKQNRFEAINTNQVISTTYSPRAHYSMPVRKPIGTALLN